MLMQQAGTADKSLRLTESVAADLQVHGHEKQ